MFEQMNKQAVTEIIMSYNGKCMVIWYLLSYICLENTFVIPVCVYICLHSVSI